MLVRGSVGGAETSPRHPVRPTSAAAYEVAASAYRTCRVHGETVRKLIDCLVAAVAVRVGSKFHAHHPNCLTGSDNAAPGDTDERTHPIRPAGPSRRGGGHHHRQPSRQRTELSRPPGNPRWHERRRRRRQREGHRVDLCRAHLHRRGRHHRVLQAAAAAVAAGSPIRHGGQPQTGDRRHSRHGAGRRPRGGHVRPFPGGGALRQVRSTRGQARAASRCRRHPTPASGHRHRQGVGDDDLRRTDRRRRSAGLRSRRSRHQRR